MLTIFYISAFEFISEKFYRTKANRIVHKVLQLFQIRDKENGKSIRKELKSQSAIVDVSANKKKHKIKVTLTA